MHKKEIVAIQDCTILVNLGKIVPGPPTMYKGGTSCKDLSHISCPSTEASTSLGGDDPG